MCPWIISARSVDFPGGPFESISRPVSPGRWVRPCTRLLLSFVVCLVVNLCRIRLMASAVNVIGWNESRLQIE